MSDKPLFLKLSPALIGIWLISGIFILVKTIGDFNPSFEYFISLFVTIAIFISIGIDALYLCTKKISERFQFIENCIIIVLYCITLYGKLNFGWKTNKIYLILFTLIAVASLLTILLFLVKKYLSNYKKKSVIEEE